MRGRTGIRETGRKEVGERGGRKGVGERRGRLGKRRSWRKK